MLQNYLQTAIGEASRAAINCGSLKVPYTVIITALILIIFFYLSRKILSKRRFLFLGLIFTFFAIGQMTADYYYGHHFYDLQHNWHYIAYGIFAFIAYRRFTIKPQPTYKILYRIFLMAILVSIFDEFIQIYISNRVFDLSDVAKDLWGNMTGSIFVFFYLEDGKDFPNYKLRQKTIKEYFTNPFSLLSLEIIFAYVFLFVSSQLTDEKYKFNLAFIVILVFLIIFILIFSGKNKVVRWIIRGALVFLAVLIFGAAHFGTPKIKYISSGHINYNGIPLMYFDYMIFPDGGFRTVDKKESFNMRDKQKIEALNPEILLIGTGSKGKGGKGWTDNEVTQMIFNITTSKIYQIIKLPNKQACDTYNRLHKEGKKILFIIHNN